MDLRFFENERKIRLCCGGEQLSTLRRFTRVKAANTKLVASVRPWPRVVVVVVVVDVVVVKLPHTLRILF